MPANVSNKAIHFEICRLCGTFALPHQNLTIIKEDTIAVVQSECLDRFHESWQDHANAREIMSSPKIC
jgi:hypothetical protein